MQSKYAKYYWCPDPTNITETNEYFWGWHVGVCPEFLHPPDNGCPANYDPVTDKTSGITDTICIRISSFTETYEDAQSKCASEGAHLVYDINQEIHVIIPIA